MDQARSVRVRGSVSAWTREMLIGGDRGTKRLADHDPVWGEGDTVAEAPVRDIRVCIDSG